MNRLVCLCFLVMAGFLHAQTEAQPTLPITQLTVKGKTIAAEVADDDRERAAGLMFREKLAPDSGMLFVMPGVNTVSFWMRNTKLPLSIAYINSTGLIMEIHSLEPLNETPVKSAFPSIAYALEMEQGWFDKNSIRAGDRLQGLPPLR